MVIEPRKVASGFALRWFSQSFELIGRAFHVWFGFAMLFCIISMSLGWLPELAVLPLGLFGCIVSIEIAATADNQVVRLADMPTILHTAAVGTVRDIWQKRWVILIVAVYMLAQFYLGHLPKPSPVREAPTPDLTSLWTWIASTDSPFFKSMLVLICGQMLQGHTAALGTLSHPLQRTFEIPEGQVRTLLHRAVFKNLPATAFMQAVPLGLIIAASMFLPILAPFLVCLLPALSYVAFREMFVDDKGNREPAKQAATSTVTQGGAA
jgi:hypothetical protein